LIDESRGDALMQIVVVLLDVLIEQLAWGLLTLYCEIMITLQLTLMHEQGQVMVGLLRLGSPLCRLGEEVGE
jgi:hypothetical protein